MTRRTVLSMVKEYAHHPTLEVVRERPRGFAVYLRQPVVAAMRALPAGTPGQWLARTRGTAIAVLRWAPTNDATRMGQDRAWALAEVDKLARIYPPALVGANASSSPAPEPRT